MRGLWTTALLIGLPSAIAAADSAALHQAGNGQTTEWLRPGVASTPAKRGVDWAEAFRKYGTGERRGPHPPWFTRLTATLMESLATRAGRIGLARAWMSVDRSVSEDSFSSFLGHLWISGNEPRYDFALGKQLLQMSTAEKRRWRAQLGLLLMAACEGDTPLERLREKVLSAARLVAGAEPDPLRPLVTALFPNVRDPIHPLYEAARRHAFEALPFLTDPIDGGDRVERLLSLSAPGLARLAEAASLKRVPEPTRAGLSSAARNRRAAAVLREFREAWYGGAPSSDEPLSTSPPGLKSLFSVRTSVCREWSKGRCRSRAWE